MSDPLLDALDAAIDSAGSFHDALVDVRAAVANGSDDPPGGDPEPGELAPPADFTATWDPQTRRVTCRWTEQDDAVEVHESATDPDNTLKETLPAGVTIRVSSELKGGHDYVWGARSVRGDEVSEFTPWVTIAVPLEGEAPDDEDEPDEDDDEGQDDGDDEQEPGDPNGTLPTDVLPILKTWTITTTTGSEGDPDNEYPVGEHAEIPGVFYVTADRGVMFHATVNGFTTEHSKRCRVEGRQMADDDWTKAEWDGNDPHELFADFWVSTAGLSKRKRVCALQIHDGGDDVLQVCGDAEEGLIVLTDDGDTMTVLDPDYEDGQRVEVRITTGDGIVRVFYNDVEKATFEKSGTSWYFKAGAYNQASMQEHGEPASAYGEVVIYDLRATGNLVAA